MAYIIILNIIEKHFSISIAPVRSWGGSLVMYKKLYMYKAVTKIINSFSDDILVFTLEKSVEYSSNIRPACLWEGNSDLDRIVGASGVVSTML
jgi:hypothetical protein